MSVRRAIDSSEFFGLRGTRELHYQTAKGNVLGGREWDGSSRALVFPHEQTCFPAEFRVEFLRRLTRDQEDGGS